MAQNEYLDEPYARTAAAHKKRLVNFPSHSAELQGAHKAYIAELAERCRGNVIDDVCFTGYADNDQPLAAARACAAAAEFTRIVPWLSPIVAMSWIDSAPLRATVNKSPEFWRGVDITCYPRQWAPAPPSSVSPPDIAPPIPGPARYSDWEVYAEWGLSFNVALMAMVSMNVYHFRRKAPNTGYGVWCASVQCGVGESMEISKCFKLARLIKTAGLSRVLMMLNHVPAGIAPTIRQAITSFARTLGGGLSLSDPSYSDANATAPFAASDLNGATARGETIGISAGNRGYSVSHLSVAQKMPVYQLKMIDNRTAPRWFLVRHATVDLVTNIDVGGWATNLPTMPSGNAQFVGGPLITL